MIIINMIIIVIMDIILINKTIIIIERTWWKFTILLATNTTFFNLGTLLYVISCVSVFGMYHFGARHLPKMFIVLKTECFVRWPLITLS